MGNTAISTEFVMCLRNVQNTDPFEETQEKKVCQKDVKRVQLPLMISMKLLTLSVTTVNKRSKFIKPIAQWKQCKWNVRDYFYNIFILSY